VTVTTVAIAVVLVILRSVFENRKISTNNQRYKFGSDTSYTHESPLAAYNFFLPFGILAG
jgi:hypothetical protein